MIPSKSELCSTIRGVISSHWMLDDPIKRDELANELADCFLKIMQTHESEPVQTLAALVATKVMGWEALHVDYFGTKDETPRQRELAQWLAEVGLSEVGDYFIDPSINFWIAQSDWRPDVDWNDMQDVIEHMEMLGYLTRIVKADDSRNPWHVRFRMQHMVDQHNGWVERQNLAEAVCLAALRRFDVEVR